MDAPGVVHVFELHPPLLDLVSGLVFGGFVDQRVVEVGFEFVLLAGCCDVELLRVVYLEA